MKNVPTPEGGTYYYNPENESRLSQSQYMEQYGSQPTTTTTAPSYESQVAKLYQEELGRAPKSAAETDYWEGLLAKGLSLDQVRQAISSSEECYNYDVNQGTIEDKPATEYEKTAADIYRQELGRDPSSKAETDMYEKMLASGKTPAEVRAIIAGSAEGKKYDYNQGVAPGVSTGTNATKTTTASTQPKSWYGSAASGSSAGVGGNVPMMATGIPDYPYQPAMVYNPNAFVQSPYLARNAYGFYAAPQGSSYSSFANPMGYQQQATGKGPSSMAGGYGYQPQAYYPQPMSMGTGAMGGGSGSSMVGYGKGPATVGYPGGSAQSSQPAQAAPQATGKGPSSGGGGGWASGGRISRATGGAALLEQLAARHLAQYGQMPGAPGTEPFARIKHSVQQPSAESVRRFAPGSLPQRPNAIKSGLDTGKQIADLYKSGKELKKDVTDFFKKEPAAPTSGGATTTTTTPGGSAPASAGANLGDRPSDVLDVADLGDKSDLLSIADFAARGGRIGYATGGGRLPTGLAPDGGIDIPDEQPNYKLNEQVPKGAGGGGSGGGLGSAIGTAASIVSAGSTLAKALPYLAAFLPSDRRVKDNAEVIGKLYDGQKVYRYDFGDGRTELGLMAQEVEKHNPDAVRSLGGLKMVDYDKATSRAHKQGGGGLGDVEEMLPADAAEGEGLNPQRIRLAALQRAETMSDADPIGLGAGAQIASAASREPTSETRPRYKIEPMNIEDMPEHRRRLLEEIGRKESADRYDIMQGNKERFDITGSHPERVGAGGTSTAAGRYQFTGPTWRDVTGGAPMTKEYQDSAAWSLASQEYKARTGRDLDKDLEEKGVTPEIRKALAGRWAVFKSEGDSAPVERATQIAQRYSKGPWEKIGEELKAPSLLRDERVIVPLVAGLGAMLASDKPRFSQALGEGLAGAAGAYGAVRGQTQDIAESAAREGLTKAQTTRARFVTVGDKTFLTYFDDKAGDDKFIDLGTAFDLMEEGKLPRLAPAVMEELRQRAQAAGRGAAKAPGAADPSAVAPKVEGVTPETVKPPTEPARKEIPLPAGVEYDDQSQAQAKEDRRRYLRVGQTQGATMLAPEYLKNTRTGAESAREDLRQFKELAGILSKAGNVTGIGVAGTAFNERAALIGATNTFIKALGGRGDVGDSAQVTQQLAEKIRTLSAASRAKEGGQESFAALERLSSAIAQPSMDKEAYSKLVAEVMTMQRRVLDRATHANRFAKDSDNVMQGAPSDFERLHPMAIYDKEAKIIQRIMTDPERPELFPALVSGKWPSGRPVTAAQIEKIGKEEGLRPGFSLYFKGGQ